MTNAGSTRPRGRRLDALLVRLIWVCLGPLLCLAGYLAFAEVVAVERQSEVRARAIAAAVARAIDQDLGGRLGALQMLAGSPLAADFSRLAEFYEEAQGFRRSFSGHVVLASLDRQMLLNTRVPFGEPLPHLPRPPSRAAAPLAIETGKPAVGDVFLGPVAKEPLVAAAVPVLRDGQVRAVLLSTFATGQFQRYLDSAALPEDWSLTLRDSAGAVIARRAPPAPDADPDARHRFAASPTIAPWTVTLGIPQSAYLAPLLRAGGALAAAILAATVAGLVGGTRAGRRLSLAVADLARPAGDAPRAAGIVEIDAARERLEAAAHQHAASEATLRRSERRFRRLFQESPVALALGSRDGRLLDLNQRFVQLFGYTLDDIPTAEAWIASAYVDPALGAQARRLWADITADDGEHRVRSIETLERQLRCKDGSDREVLLSGIGIDDEFLFTLVDVTGRRQAAESGRRLAAIVQSSEDAIIGKTLDGVITSWNPGAAKLFGHSEAEALGRSMRMLIPADRAGEEDEILARLRHGATVDHFETVRVRKDGSLVDISATISPIRDERGEVIGASKIARDITDRRQAELRLRAHLERLQLLDQLTTAIGERQDVASIHRVVLRRLEERMPADFVCMLGVTAAGGALEVLGVGPGGASLASQMGMGLGQHLALAAADRERCERGEVIQESDAGDPAIARFAFSHQMAGCGLRAIVLAPVCSQHGMTGALLVARREAHSFASGECEFLRQLCAHLGLADQQARLHEALQNAYDELRQTQQAVMQQERLRALGQMASGVAHDINNAIAPVLLYCETLLEHEQDLSPRSRKYLQTIARSVDDVAATVARLREFYRPQQLGQRPVPIELQPLVEQVMELTRARWHDMPLQRGAVIEARSVVADGLPPVMGVESEIREALINLVFNAADAMPEGGTLTLSTHLSDAGMVELSVADTGLGMDEETRRRCIEPFFTTKGERGTGLGLAMVYGIAQRHGAELRVDSVPGRGTIVSLLFLPPATAELAAAAVEVPAPTRQLRLLLVDDDPVVLGSLRETLELDGHSVRTADGGEAGIEAFRAALREGAVYDAVITDLGMPYVDGREVARTVKAASPATPVILATGWGQRLVAEGAMPAHVDRVLSKPTRLRELRLALAAVAAGTAGRPDSENSEGGT